jgi:hypothetical protein
MKIEYTLEENDYLEFQMFSSATSPNQIRTRKKSKWLLMISFTVLAFINLTTGDKIGGIVFTLLAILAFFVYPYWQKRHHKRHFKNHINEVNKPSFGIKNTLDIDDNFILSKSNGIEGKIPCSEVKEIIELKEHFFIVLNMYQAFILPKSQIQLIEDFRAFLKDFSTKLNIDYSVMNNYYWH